MNIETLPACFSTESRYTATTSEQFAPISTARAIKPLLDAGWNITDYSVKKIRNANLDRAPYTKHLLRISHPDLQPIDGHRCEVIAQNGNDSSSSFRFLAGIWRAACANGLVVGMSISSIRINHIGDPSAMNKKLSNAVRGISDEFPRLHSQIQQWQQMSVPVEQVTMFGRMAHSLRKDTKVNDVNLIIGGAVGGRSKRIEDTQNTLWNVFNRTQENVVRGMGSRVTRRISGMDKALKINRQMWDICELAGQGKLPMAYELAHEMPTSEAIKIALN